MFFVQNRCEPRVSNAETVTEEIQTQKEVKASTASVGTQTISFGEVLDLLEETQAELKKLKATLQNKEFTPENIPDDVKMKALTSFTREEFFGWYKFLKIEKPLSIGSKRRPIDRFYLFMIKLRTGISNEFLSVLFDISDSTVSRDFNFVTEVIFSKLKMYPIFPKKSQVIEYMPPTFRMHFKDVRIIVDCTEFAIQKPSSPEEQQMTFSHYKNANTIKGMIGITPNGAISFISELYCGSISDKQLFIESKLMDLLEPNDVVMADKGFLIANEFESIGCKLLCPIFLRDKIQFNISEMVSNCQLSNGRVIVERAIGRIKQYKYFEGALPYRSLHNVNRVFFIVSMFCNFHKPLIQVT
ncbi:THAP-type domain-containing protein [Trichonephila clavata]|uniref:THAP-type domain-containing protein n=1 Tax=Trichonephila clavata TaxID=2740835 RepID=A0A8X6KER1_TRICU|nr:THAP-type domain-containing protein [Trichonephila clavata]